MEAVMSRFQPVLEAAPIEEPDVPVHFEYKVIQGQPRAIEERLNELSQEDWRPVATAGLSFAAMIAVILQRESPRERE